MLLSHISSIAGGAGDSSMPKTGQDLLSILTGPFITDGEASPPITGSIKIDECEELKTCQMHQEQQQLSPRAFKNTGEMKAIP